jgi:hypothetical protein
VTFFFPSVIHLFPPKYETDTTFLATNPTHIYTSRYISAVE